MFDINHDNFYDHTDGYYQLLFPTTGWTPTIVFHGNGIGKAGIDIGFCDNNNEYEIFNGMSCYFVLFILVQNIQN